MKESSDLYDLIHSLSKSEKRYISLSMREKSGKAHLNLFQAIEKQKVFKEGEINIILQKEKLILPLSTVKVYLHNYILKKLNGFYYESSTQNRLHQSLLEIDILIKRGLYSQAKKKLEKTKRICLKNERFEVALQCINSEKLLLNRNFYLGTTEQDLNNFLKQEKCLTKKIDNLNTYKLISGKLAAYEYRHGRDVRTRYQKEKIQGFLKHPLMRDQSKTLSDSAKYLYFSICANCYNLLNENQKALKSNKAIIELFESGNYTFNLNNYISTLSNNVFLLSNLKNYASAFEYIEKIRNRIDKSKTKVNLTEIRLFLIHSYVLELDLLINSARFEQALERIPAIELVLKESLHITGEQRLMIFYYNFSYIHFGLGNYKKALYYLNLILNQKIPDESMYENLYSISSILYLLAVYEIKKENSAKNLTKRISNLLAKRNLFFKSENIFLRFIRQKLFKKAEPDILIHGFHNLKEKMIYFQGNVYERNFTKNFDFISWIESKISKKPFIEVLKENHKSLDYPGGSSPFFRAI